MLDLPLRRHRGIHVNLLHDARRRRSGVKGVRLLGAQRSKLLVARFEQILHRLYLFAELCLRVAMSG